MKAVLEKLCFLGCVNYGYVWKEFWTWSFLGSDLLQWWNSKP